MAKSKPANQDVSQKDVAAVASGVGNYVPTTDELRALAIPYRYELVWFFEVTMGNPNGDPDLANSPRMDQETGYGYVTSVCQKRWVRDYVLRKYHANGVVPGMDIYVKDGGVLNDEHRKAYWAMDLPISDELSDADFGDAVRKQYKGDEPFQVKAARWMAANYWDTRSFGGMLATKIPIQKLVGPVQVTPAVSVHQITTLDPSITRVAVTTRGESTEGKEHMFGRQNLIPYGLYRSHIFINPFLAERTGFSEKDFMILLDALRECFELRRSSANGTMASCHLWVFRHDLRLGNARASELFRLIRVRRKQEEGEDGPEEPKTPPRRLEDFEFEVDKHQVPAGVTLTQVF